MLALLSPDDEKAFKAIRKVVLGGSGEERLEPYQISYLQLSKLEPLVEAAKKFESALHKSDKEKKSANWLIKAAKDADLMLDDNMKAQITETLGDKALNSLEGSGKKKKNSEVVAPIDVIEDSGARHKTKELSKVQ